VQTLALIPARGASTRLPGKALADLGGAPLVWRVVEATRRCPVFDAVVVATDDPAVQAAVQTRGGQTVRVDAPCASGTARVARAAAVLAPGAGPEVVVVNVQGDEPFVEPAVLAALVAAVRAGAPIATAAAPLPPGAAEDPHSVKVVADAQGRALYFSRAAIPGALHLGLYAFNAPALQAVAHLARGPLAAAEDLEQLAWLEAGWPIAVIAAPPTLKGVDTPADLARARAEFAARPPPDPQERCP
jgi:3-deoxy-manno-octulosonate cytidylyltransferase (CMP-KDO synthetase)